MKYPDFTQNIFKAHVFSWKLDDGFAYHIAVEHFSDNIFTMLKVKKVEKKPLLKKQERKVFYYNKS
jgi:hypothetical protein